MKESRNPYIGLRPFESKDSLFFFGRNEQVGELMDRLHQHRFLAVVGSSGSGKSSLIKAGLIPNLKAGYLVRERINWAMASMKPGRNPLYNLATAIVSSLQSTEGGYTADQIKKDISESGVDAILEKLKPLFKANDTNYFLLVDQFEELFRFASTKAHALEDPNSINHDDEATDFVNLLLALSRQEDWPIYVVITMRSDFIGDCARFYGLPEALNKSQYLVPRLTRLQRKQAIEGPARLIGENINSGLTARLLNDVGSVNDELPLLQHALMRIWDYEKKIDKNGQLDLNDYEQVGGISKALSNHADEVIVGMNEEDLLLTKRIFQALTTVDENGRKIRRPSPLSELEKVTQSTKEQVLQKIDLFIQDNRSFLVKNKIEDEEDDLLIDISHESLIRQWTTLNEWVEEEQKAAETYLNLVKAGQLYKQKKRDHLTELEIQEAQYWIDTFKPHEAWASRYSEDYGSARDYFTESTKWWKEEQERKKIAEQQEKEIAEGKMKLKRARVITVVIAASTLISIGFLIYAMVQRTEAQANAAKALLQKEKADSTAIVAREQAFLAQLEKEKADNAAVEASIQTLRADTARKLAEYQRELAILQRSEAEKQRALAEESAREAIRQKDLADLNLNKALFAKAETDSLKEAVLLNSRRQIQAWVTKDPTVALRISEAVLKVNEDSVVSSLAYKIYKENSFYKIAAGHTEAITSVAFSPDGDQILTGSFDNTARLWDVKGDLIRTFTGHTSQIYSVAFSPDGDQILTGSWDKTARLWDVKGDLIRTFTDTQEIYSVAFSPDGDQILTGSWDKTARLWDVKGDQLRTFTGHTSYIYSVAFSPDGAQILTGSRDNTARLWDVKGDLIQTFTGHTDAIFSVAFSPDGDQILTGSLDKTARLWDVKGDQLRTFTGHTKVILSVVFSPDGEQILTGSWDKTARLWDVKGDLIRTFTGHTDRIYSVAFSPDGDQILTGSLDKTARLWDVKPQLRWTKWQDYLNSGRVELLTKEQQEEFGI